MFLLCFENTCGVMLLLLSLTVLQCLGLVIVYKQQWISMLFWNTRPSYQQSAALELIFEYAIFICMVSFFVCLHFFLKRSFSRLAYWLLIKKNLGGLDPGNHWFLFLSANFRRNVQKLWTHCTQWSQLESTDNVNSESGRGGRCSWEAYLWLNWSFLLCVDHTI